MIPRGKFTLPANLAAEFSTSFAVKFLPIRSLKFPDRYLLAGFAAMAAVLLIYFHPGLFHINDTLFSAGGDGLKNFYTLAYYVENDSGLWFTGMLYPYGEHVSFTDNQPLVAMTLRFIDRSLFDISPYLLGIANALLFLNFFFCAYLLYRIFLHLNLPRGYSMVCAILITLVSPTIIRMVGHNSLSYSFLLPLAIYLVMRYETALPAGKTRIAFLLGTASFLSALLHPYWVIIIAMVVTVYGLIKTLFEKKLPVRLLLAGLAGPLLFKILLVLTDPVTDRPQDPWGAAEFAAWTNTIFFPPFEPYNWLRNVLQVEHAGLENRAYVGTPGILFLLALAFRFISGVLKKRKVNPQFLPIPPVLKYLFITGVLILLLSMFIPFRFGLEELYYRIPFLNQFRSLGRFAWAFYFIFSIYYAYGFFLLLKRLRVWKGVGIAVAAGILLLVIWGSDVHFTLHQVRRDVSKYGGRNVLKKNNLVADLLATTAYKPADFQALFPLPVVAIGSEKLALDGGWLNNQLMFPYSYTTGTPILGCMMSRTSIRRTLDLVALTGSDYSEKKIPADLPSNLPLLVIAKPGEAQGSLTAKYTLLAEGKDVALYLLPVDSLRKLKTIDRDSIEFIRKNYTFSDGFFTDDTSKSIFYKSFQNMGDTGDDEMVDVAKFKMKMQPSDAIYSFSCWIKITPFGNKVPYFRVTQFDSAGVPLTNKATGTNLINGYDVSGDWIRFEDTLRMLPSAREVELEINGKKSIIDHVLFCPENTRVVALPENLPNKVYVNNYLVQVKE